MPYNIPFIAVALLMGVALFIILFKRNLIKIIMGIAILGAGVNLFLVTLGYRAGGVAPIYTVAPEGVMVLPVPQALTLTNIVITVSVIALMLTMVMFTYRHMGDIDAKKSRLLRG
ncbi:MAG TPA: cation:proton antiporter subunit C [Dehalococcoidia bacterium]|nr:cation:proton antiporter subunit C [Dehalococcoidia bacterium]